MSNQDFKNTAYVGRFGHFVCVFVFVAVFVIVFVIVFVFVFVCVSSLIFEQLSS